MTMNRAVFPGTLGYCHQRPSSLQVLKLRDVLRFDVDSSVTERMALEKFALKCLRYKMDEAVKEVDDQLKFYVTDEYKVP